MIRLKYAIGILFLMLSYVGAANAQSLYGLANDGPDGESFLYLIDTSSGAAQFIGGTGFERCGGMDFDVVNQRLIAACQRHDGSNQGVLIEIDPLTGQGSELGLLGCDTSTDISFRPSDNALFGASFDDDIMGFCPVFGLTAINASTGDTNFLGGLAPRIGCCGNGMAFSQIDSLFLADQEELYSVNQSNGSLTQLTALSYLPPAANTPRINSMDLNPQTGEMFAAVVGGGREFGPIRSFFLARVDLNTGVVTVIGETVEGIDAIAFTGNADLTRPIPALSEIGLISTAILFFVAALFILRRRQRAVDPEY